MTHPSRALLREAADALAWLSPEPVFFGGSIVPLYLDDPAALLDARETDDVDLVVAVATRPAEARFEAELRRHGFRHPLEEARAPRFRWVRGDLRIDAVPEVELSPRDWVHPERRRTAGVRLDAKGEITILSYCTLLAAKIAAFQDPARARAGDWLASADIEDVVLLLDASHSFDLHVANDEPARAYVADWCSTALSRPTLAMDLHGLVSRDHRDARVERVMSRMRALSAHKP